MPLNGNACPAELSEARVPGNKAITGTIIGVVVFCMIMYSFASFYKADTTAGVE